MAVHLTYRACTRSPYAYGHSSPFHSAVWQTHHPARRLVWHRRHTSSPMIQHRAWQCNRQIRHRRTSRMSKPTNGYTPNSHITDTQRKHHETGALTPGRTRPTSQGVLRTLHRSAAQQYIWMWLQNEQAGTCRSSKSAICKRPTCRHPKRGNQECWWGGLPGSPKLNTTSFQDASHPNPLF